MFILNPENPYYTSVHGHFRKQNFEEKKLPVDINIIVYQYSVWLFYFNLMKNSLSSIRFFFQTASYNHAADRKTIFNGLNYSL